MFVIGGSYKAFYLNYLAGLNKPDIIIFNQNIFYDFDIDNERGFNGPVSTELKALNTIFNCPIVVYGTRVKNNKGDKSFIVCSMGKIKIFDQHCDIYLKVKNHYILIGAKQYFLSNSFATISICDNTNSYKLNKNIIRNYFCVNSKSVILNLGGKFYKKFNKCCKFIL